VRRSRIGTWALGIAAVLAIAVLGAWNVQLQARLAGVQADLDSAAAYQRGIAAVLDVGTRSGAQTAFLASTKPGVKTGGVAAAAPDGTVVMALHDLAPTAGNQVYEAWVIVGQEAPVALGGFTVGSDGNGLLRASTSLAEPGAVLALTLEPLPGATAPAGPIVSAGSLVAPTS
jgi:anti-sigma-K factor RskA